MLSAVIIAHNEVENLPRCLASLVGVVDEVVVVDSGSTDGTQDLAMSLGAKVLSRPFTSYADQKNWAAQQASHPFVLSLDADEALGRELQLEIKQWKEDLSTVEEHEVAWSMPRKTSYCGQWVHHSGWYPDRKTRLWRKGTGAWQTSAPGVVLHEEWLPSEGGRVVPMASDLLHFSYASRPDHWRQLAQFSMLGARDAVLKGVKSSWVKPWARAVFQWTKHFGAQSGWRDGRTGWDIARWSALAAFWKWRQVSALDRRRPLKRVAVVRTDGLGDNVLTLPLAGALKWHQPDMEVIWVCRPYASALASMSQHVDEVQTWSPEDEGNALSWLQNLDAVVFAFPEPTLMAAAAKCDVPVRVATGRRWSGLWHANVRMWRSRRRRPVHETLQGLRLLHGLNVPAAWRFPEPSDWPSLVGWPSPVSGASEVSEAPTALLHPGNHGSANGWSVPRFQALADLLLAAGWRVVVTGTLRERPPLEDWLAGLSSSSGLVDAVGKWDLSELLAELGHVDVVVASSTGPLHMASALGTPVVGLYRDEAPFWAARWAPLGKAHVLATSALDEEGGLQIGEQEVLDAMRQLVLRG